MITDPDVEYATLVKRLTAGWSQSRLQSHVAAREEYLGSRVRRGDALDQLRRAALDITLIAEALFTHGELNALLDAARERDYRRTFA